MSKPELAQYYTEKSGDGRGYKHPFRTYSDGSPLVSPSVTTVLKLVNKEALIQWAVNKTLDWAVDNVSLLYVKSHEDAVRAGKYRWTDTRDERAEVGTGIHETIESEHTGAWNYPPLDREQLAIMDQWAKFKERYEITPHRSEFTVWAGVPRLDSGMTASQSDNWYHHAYAGTADGLWDITDRQTGESWSNLYIDLKTSNNTWPEHWYQLAALRRADVIMRKVDPNIKPDSKGVWPAGSWVEEEPPAGDGIAIVHLKASMNELKLETDAKMIDHYFTSFLSYRQAWVSQKDTEAYDKTRRLSFS